MDIPASFRESRIEVMHDFMRAHPFGLLISAGAGGLQATPLPFLLEADGGQGTLRAHLARANPHGQALAGAGECLVVFQGEQGYFMPSWYASKAATGKAVPTWNYTAVHAWGRPAVVEDAVWLRRQLGTSPAARRRGARSHGRWATRPTITSRRRCGRSSASRSRSRGSRASGS